MHQIFFQKNVTWHFGFLPPSPLIFLVTLLRTPPPPAQAPKSVTYYLNGPNVYFLSNISWCSNFHLKMWSWMNEGHGKSSLNSLSFFLFNGERNLKRFKPGRNSYQTFYFVKQIFFFHFYYQAWLFHSIFFIFMTRSGL